MTKIIDLKKYLSLMTNTTATKSKPLTPKEILVLCRHLEIEYQYNLRTDLVKRAQEAE